jgi:peptidoglycan/LPS O-acetylase OafA/YrhL
MGITGRPTCGGYVIVPQIDGVNKPESDSLIAYRADIDGLRAIAVIAVIGYHAFPEMIPGGFVGVDVFFVVSGFLISSLLFERLQTGDFSLLEFYVRRIRRIIPALVIVIATTLAIGWQLLYPDEFASLGNHALSAVAFFSNFTLWKETGYFDVAAETKPLLHLWSLGVEEQFYIVWPIMLYLAWRLYVALPVIAFLTVASFCGALYLIERDSAGAFYLPVTRAWELFAGAGLSYGYLFYSQRCEAIRANLMALGGLVLIASAIFALDRTLPYPGVTALLPVVGTLLVIMAGSEAQINRSLLSSRFLVGLGLISYPLYLWHWPLLVFAQILYPEPTVWITIATIALSVVLAVATYLLIESPIRFGALRPFSMPVACGSLLILGIASLAISTSRIIPNDLHRLPASIVNSRNEWEYPAPPRPFDDDGKAINLLTSEIPERVLFWGDSAIEQYWPRVDELIKRNPASTLSVAFATGGGCPPVRNVFEAKHPGCDGLADAAIKYAKSADVQSVVIGALWFGYLSGEFARRNRFRYFYRMGPTRAEINRESRGTSLFLRELKAEISELKNAGKHIYLILNTPMAPMLDPINLYRRVSGVNSHLKGVATAEVIARYGDIATSLREVAKQAGATIIDPMDFLCSAERCASVEENGEAIYRDISHLRPSFTRYKIKYLDAVISLK